LQLEKRRLTGGRQNNKRRFLNMSPTLYLICGKAGAGKTTLAKKLENEEKVIRLSKDEWILSLFGRSLTSEEWNKAELRVCTTLTQFASDLLAQGKSVALDFGFWYRKERLSAKQIADSAGAKAKLYYLATTDEIRRERVLARNAQPDPASVEISQEQLNMQGDWFEEPSEDEMELVLVVQDMQLRS
jgi:predicted kinase